MLTRYRSNLRDRRRERRNLAEFERVLRTASPGMQGDLLAMEGRRR
ncbi:MAG: hypothetical protein JO147_04955 [Actinobacteria bacterium]|nr:hypothetical protein [Actinomycetota bacterium]